MGHAFIDAYEHTGEQEFLRVATSICDFIIGNIPQEITSNGKCLSYIPGSQISIHNSNLLGAAILARTYRHAGNEEYAATAKNAVDYSCSRQMENGAWYYGEEEKYHWIDNFHTGYNIESLLYYSHAIGDDTIKDTIARGMRFFIDNFFHEDYVPKYYHDTLYPIDIQCASQSIETLVHYSKYDRNSLMKAAGVAEWTIRHMQGSSGYFYYRKLPWMTMKTPMMHWGEATMFHGLAALLSKLADIKTAEDDKQFE